MGGRPCRQSYTSCAGELLVQLLPAFAPAGNGLGRLSGRFGCGGEELGLKIPDTVPGLEELEFWVLDGFDPWTHEAHLRGKYLQGVGHSGVGAFEVAGDEEAAGFFD